MFLFFKCEKDGEFYMIPHDEIRGIQVKPVDNHEQIHEINQQVLKEDAEKKKQAFTWTEYKKLHWHQFNEVNVYMKNSNSTTAFNVVQVYTQGERLLDSMREFAIRKERQQ